jgi:hypothetical protein
MAADNVFVADNLLTLYTFGQSQEFYRIYYANNTFYVYDCPAQASVKEYHVTQNDFQKSFEDAEDYVLIAIKKKIKKDEYSEITKNSFNHVKDIPLQLDDSQPWLKLQNKVNDGDFVPGGDEMKHLDDPKTKKKYVSRQNYRFDPSKYPELIGMEFDPYHDGEKTIELRFYEQNEDKFDELVQELINKDLITGYNFSDAPNDGKTVASYLNVRNILNMIKRGFSGKKTRLKKTAFNYLDVIDDAKEIDELKNKEVGEQQDQSNGEKVNDLLTGAKIVATFFDQEDIKDASSARCVSFIIDHFNQFIAFGPGADVEIAQYIQDHQGNQLAPEGFATALQNGGLKTVAAFSDFFKAEDWILNVQQAHIMSRVVDGGYKASYENNDPVWEAYLQAHFPKAPEQEPKGLGETIDVDGKEVKDNPQQLDQNPQQLNQPDTQTQTQDQQNENQDEGNKVRRLRVHFVPYTQGKDLREDLCQWIRNNDNVVLKPGQKPAA